MLTWLRDRRAWRKHRREWDSGVAWRAFRALRVDGRRMAERQVSCGHKGYSFEKHGRCCGHCGKFLTDFGD